jgi:hypothetical protein
MSSLSGFLPSSSLTAIVAIGNGGSRRFNRVERLSRDGCYLGEWEEMKSTKVDWAERASIWVVESCGGRVGVEIGWKVVSGLGHFLFRLGALVCSPLHSP